MGEVEELNREFMRAQQHNGAARDASSDIVDWEVCQPVLELEFADLQTRKKLGTRIEIVSASVEVPSPESLPRYGKPPRTFYGVPMDPPDMPNPDYYREIAAYLRETAFLCPVGLAVTNPSSPMSRNTKS